MAVLIVISFRRTRSSRSSLMNWFLVAWTAGLDLAPTILFLAAK